MAEYENEELGVRFTLPDALNPFQQLAFRGKTAVGGGGVFVRFWDGAIELIQEWECEAIPEYKDLDLHADIDDPVEAARIADIVQFVANSTAAHITALEAVPKNA